LRVNVNGYIFGQNAPPYYRVNTANLGGISTAAGGNVTIDAGRDVISYLPTQTDFNDNNSRFDGGTGAFGSQPGNVSITTAGRNVYGHFVLANGFGTITAGGDIGVPLLGAQSQDFALSLIKGGWTVTAVGNIYVQDVRNPNGIFKRSATFPATLGTITLITIRRLSVIFTGNSVENHRR